MSKVLRILLLFCASLPLSSCFRHSYRAQPYNLCQTDLGERVADAGLVEGEFCGPWWNFFQDPQLSRFIELSLACHPDIRIADARIRLACNQARIVKSSLFPHIFAIADVERQKISDLGTGFVPGLPDLFTQTTVELASAVFELDIWQKNRSHYLAALDHMRAEIAGFEEAKLLLSTTIAAVYFDLQMHLARKEIGELRVKAKKELLDLHKQQFDKGIASEFRLYQVDSELQFLKDQLYLIEAQIAIDEHALAALVGNIGCGAEFSCVPNARFDEPFPLPATLPIDFLLRRPDITAKKWLVEAACYDIKAARANFFPRIDLMGWLGFQSIKIEKLFRGAQLIALGEATATLPLFMAGKLTAQLGVAREDLEIAIENYNQNVLDAVKQVSDALSNLTISIEREKSIKKAVKDTAQLLSLTRQKFENAIETKLSVLNAVENYYYQKDLEAQIQLARYASAVELIRAIGGGYHECPR